jgi:hypothetical protein
VTINPNPLLEHVAGMVARLDGEFGCCHSAEQIMAGTTGPDCEAHHYDKFVRLLNQAIDTGDVLITDRLGSACLHGDLCTCSFGPQQ